MKRTIIIRRDYLHYIKKYNRFEKRHRNIAAHCSPAFRIKEGDVVIDFDQVRNALGPYCGQDPLAALFSQALKDWSGTDKN